MICKVQEHYHVKSNTTLQYHQNKYFQKLQWRIVEMLNQWAKWGIMVNIVMQAGLFYEFRTLP
jgi:hypothetical protein